MFGDEAALANLARRNPVARRLLMHGGVPPLATAQWVGLSVAFVTVTGHILSINSLGEDRLWVYLLLMLVLLILPLAVATRATLFVTQEMNRPGFDLLLVTPLPPEAFVQAFVRIVRYRGRLWLAVGYGLLPVLISPLLVEVIFAPVGYSSTEVMLALIALVSLLAFALGPLALCRTAQVVAVRVGVVWRGAPWVALLLAPAYTLLTGLTCTAVVLVPAYCLLVLVSPSLGLTSLGMVGDIFVLTAIPTGIFGTIDWLIGGPAYRWWLERAARAVVAITER
ncbi:MAG: hypothetical protein JW910_09460 [Anaerolineae bacterium]|nr:hypothetical protein [Anaerolineae bacterium]